MSQQRKELSWLCARWHQSHLLIRASGSDSPSEGKPCHPLGQQNELAGLPGNGCMLRTEAGERAGCWRQTEFQLAAHTTDSKQDL